MCLHAALILTRLGKPLLYCAVGAYAKSPTLRPASLAGLLSTMQDMTGHPPTATSMVGNVHLALVEAGGTIVAVLYTASDSATRPALTAREDVQASKGEADGCSCGDAVSSEWHATARLTGQQLLRAFRARYGPLVASLEAEHEHQIKAAVAAYTFQSATKASDEDGVSTLSQFVAFQRTYVQPLLMQPRLQSSCIRPLCQCSTMLRGFVLQPRDASTAVSSAGMDDKRGSIGGQCDILFSTEAQGASALAVEVRVISSI